MVFFQRTAHYLFFLIALIQALAYRWVCDDAFISFRYARNLTKGLGLVFNEGERVEGYTNFLWTLLLSLGFQFKLNPIPYSENLGVLFYLGTLFVTYYFAKKINARQRNYFPIAFCGLAVHKYMHTFASSGLETSFFTFLVLSAYYYVFLAEDLKPRLIAFTLLNLAALTRPEGLLYYFVAAFYIYYLDIKNGILYRGSTGKEILLRSLHHIPFLIIYIPYFIWKYNYYGFLLPNTYYAKSGGGIYFSQGWKYLEIFCDAYYFLYTLPFFLILYLFRLRKERNTHRNFLLIFIAPLLHLLYILKVGGDFMFARFFIPLLPFVYILFEIFLYRFFRKIDNTLKFVALIILTLLFMDPYKGTSVPIINGISNEREIYKPNNVTYLMLKILSWKPHFERANVRFAFGGAQAIYAYYLENNYAIEAECGLTDSYLAHRKISMRGRVGHEKEAPLSYLKEKGIHLHMSGEEGHWGEEKYKGYIKGLPGEINIIYDDPNVINILRQHPDIQFPNY